MVKKEILKEIVKRTKKLEAKCVNSFDTHDIGGIVVCEYYFRIRKWNEIEVPDVPIEVTFETFELEEIYFDETFSLGQIVVFEDREDIKTLVSDFFIYIDTEYLSHWSEEDRQKFYLDFLKSLENGRWEGLVWGLFKIIS